MYFILSCSYFTYYKYIISNLFMYFCDADLISEMFKKQNTLAEVKFCCDIVAKNTLNWELQFNPVWLKK